MHIYNPGRILQGTQLSTLFDEAEVPQRLGGHTFLVTNPDLVRDGTIQTIRQELERAGIESILFEGADEKAAGDTIREAVNLASGGRTGHVIGVGPPITLDIAKMVSAAAGSERSFYQLMDGKTGDMSDASLPFLAVPTRCWNPLLFSDSAAVTDPRDRLPKFVRTGIYPDAVFFLTGLPDALTEKQTLYDLLCILAQSIESMHHVRGFAGYPLLLQPISKAISLLRAIPTADAPPDRAQIQTAGIHSSWIAPSPGTGYVLGRCAHAKTGAAPEWVAAALLPAAARYYLQQHSRLVPELLSLLELEPTGEAENGVSQSPEDDIEAIEMELRSLAGFADVPLRLRDLGIDSDSLPDIAACASGMSGGETENYHGLLQTAL